VIGLCTDSSSQITVELARRYDIEVVPLTVIIDGEAFLEGIDIDADSFWARFTSPITTAAPSPGQFLAAYQALADRGATEILSVHVSLVVSSTVEAARLAAREAPVKVTVVDSGAASFGVTCAIWEAAEALRAGADIQDAARVATSVGASTGNVFVVGGLELARRAGRLDPNAHAGAGVPVLSMIGGTMTVIDRISDLRAAVRAMADHISGPALRVAIGTADGGTEALAQALEARLGAKDGVVELIRYRIGPSVGAHTGPGTVGAYYYPLKR
jgi:DegV family protein with EDD domain